MIRAPGPGRKQLMIRHAPYSTLKIKRGCKTKTIPSGSANEGKEASVLRANRQVGLR